MYPIMLDLRDRPCLLVGAGQIGHHKLQSLLSEGARVTVVAPTACESVARLAAERQIEWRQRPFVDTDLDGVALALVATGDREVDQAVVTAAKSRGIWVNVADVPDLCDFHLPSRVQRGDMQIAIASGGHAPFAVRRLRQILEAKLGTVWTEWMAAAKRFRLRVRAETRSPEATNAAFDRWVAGTVDPATLTARVPTREEETHWLAGTNKTEPGSVTLVGAGPGHPGLMTVRGLELLRSAHAVVFDRLAIPSIPLDLPDHIQLVSVGKEAGHHPVPQEQINQILLSLAQAGKRVVRLKGGDPFVFARGGEEAMVLQAHGIAYQVVPGVTSGIAAAAAAGIPVTFRREAIRVTFITAHEGGTPQVRWDLLARDEHATLVGYMGVSSLAEVRDHLMAAGMSGDTPAALIERASLPGQRSLRTTLLDLPEAATRSGMQSPAIFVIGRVVAHAQSISPAALPLQGMTVGVLGPACTLARALEACGAHILCAPNPFTAATRLVLGAVPPSAWLVRHRGELDAISEERARTPLLAGVPLLCQDEELAALARPQGWVRVTVLDGSDPSNGLQVGGPT